MPEGIYIYIYKETIKLTYLALGKYQHNVYIKNYCQGVLRKSLSTAECTQKIGETSWKSTTTQKEAITNLLITLYAIFKNRVRTF